MTSTPKPRSIGQIWWSADNAQQANQWRHDLEARGALDVELKPEPDRPIVDVIITLWRETAKDVLGHEPGDEEWLDTEGKTVELAFDVKMQSVARVTVPLNTPDVMQFAMDSLQKLDGIEIGWSNGTTRLTEGSLHEVDEKAFEVISQSDAGERPAGVTRFLRQKLGQFDPTKTVVFEVLGQDQAMPKFTRVALYQDLKDGLSNITPDIASRLGISSSAHRGSGVNTEIVVHCDIPADIDKEIRRQVLLRPSAALNRAAPRLQSLASFVNEELMDEDNEPASTNRPKA